MSDSPETLAPKPGRRGGYLGAILSVLLWFNQPGDLLNVSPVAEYVILAAFVVVCVLAGTMIERLLSKG